MAVTYSGGHQGLLNHLEVGQHYLDALATLGGKLTFVMDNFKVANSKSGVTGKMSHSAANLCKLPQGGNTVKQAKLQIEAAICKFASNVDPLGLKVKVKPMLGPVPDFVAKPSPAPAPVAPAGWPEKLSDAGKMYQPVKGTSQGSVYSTVALSETMKVAVRVGADKLSVRVEGSCVSNPTMIKKMAELGLTESKGSHYSMHMSCGNVPVERVIGAILAGLGVEFATPVPQLSRVKETCK